MPRPGRWRAAFTVRKAARGARLHRELHGAVGIWSLAIFIVVTFSGVYIAFPRETAAVINTVFPGRDLRAASVMRVEPVRGAPKMAINRAVTLAREASGGVHQGDFEAALHKRATQVVFNGRAFQYQEHPIALNVGDKVRLFVANAGPSLRSDFHVVGTVFDRVYPGANPRDAIQGVQTWTVPAGGGAVFETTFETAGSYPFVTHAFADASLGAVGLFQVGDVRTMMTH